MLRQVGPPFSPLNTSLWRTRPCPIRPCPPPRLPFTPSTVSLTFCIPLNTGLLLGPLHGPFTPGPLHMPFRLPEAPPPYSHLTFNSPPGSTQVSHPQGSLSNSQMKSAPLPPLLSQHLGECGYRAHSPPRVPEDKRPWWSRWLLCNQRQAHRQGSENVRWWLEDRRTDRVRARKGSFPRLPTGTLSAVPGCGDL